MPLAYGPGTILIPNEVTNNQAGLLSLPSGAFLSGTLPLLTSGEGGAQLANGLVAFTTNPNEGFVTGVAVYTGLTLIGHVQVFSSTVRWDTFSPMASDFTSTFYVAKVDFFLPTTLIGAVGSNGVVGPTQWNLGAVGISSLGVDQANTTFYYATASSSGGASDPGVPIKSWVLATDSAGPQIVAGSGTLVWLEDLLVVPGTQTFLIIAQPNDLVQAFEVRQYTLTGTLVATFPIVANAAAFSTPRLSLDLANPSTVFWVRTFEDGTGATSHFTQLTLSTGAVLDDIPHIPSDSSNPLDIPVSCPFFAWDPTGPSGTPGCFPGDFNGTPSLQACLPTGISGV